MKKIIAILLITLTAASFLCAGGNKDMAKFPEKPVTIIVPWGVGGASDLLFRAVAKSFPKYANGQQLIIKNIDGAASVQGVTEYMGMRPDGYTILMWATAQTIKTQMAKVPYASDNFSGLFSAVNDNPYILVHKDSPFKTVNDLVAYAKANPGKLTMANAGAGGGVHLAALQFTLAADIKVNHVPFGGGAASTKAVLGKEVDCSVNVPSEGLTNVAAGDLRMLAVLGEKRMSGFPNVPTAKEQGIDAVNKQTRGAVINKEAPAEIIAAYNKIFRQMCEDPEFQKAVKDLSMNFEYADGSAYEKQIAEENALYMNIIQTNKLGDRYK